MEQEVFFDAAEHFGGFGTDDSLAAQVASWNTVEQFEATVEEAKEAGLKYCKAFLSEDDGAPYVAFSNDYEFGMTSLEELKGRAIERYWDEVLDMCFKYEDEI
jgi:hypothetical protein